jgi:hypothetical protein
LRIFTGTSFAFWAQKPNQAHLGAYYCKPTLPKNKVLFGLLPDFSRNFLQKPQGKEHQRHTVAQAGRPKVPHRAQPLAEQAKKEDTAAQNPQQHIDPQFPVAK